MTQLEWESHVVEYVSWAYNFTKSKNGRASPLKAEIPLLGPRFIPPSYMHAHRRRSVPDIQPETAYMKVLTVIHPLYFDTLAMCPKCDATGADVAWSGWTSTGHCEVHGLDREETALGYQLRCKNCAGVAVGEKTSSKNGEGSHCFSTTNHTFWERREHWQVPGEYSVQRENVRFTHSILVAGVPHFMKRCALTRELFNLIIEFRLSMTSAGLAEHIRREQYQRCVSEGRLLSAQNSISADTTKSDWRTCRAMSDSLTRANGAYSRC